MKRAKKMLWVFAGIIALAILGRLIEDDAPHTPARSTTPTVTTTQVTAPVSQTRDSGRYRPYTEKALRKLVKDYTTNESVVYNASKSVLRYPHNRKMVENWSRVVEARELQMGNDRLMACFLLAVSDSGKDGTRFLQVAKELYGF